HTLRQFYLPPFYSAVEAGTASLMSAFNSLNGVPSSANPFTLKQVLRKEWDFKGLVVSAWNAVGEVIPRGVACDGATAARKALLPVAKGTQEFALIGPLGEDSSYPNGVPPGSGPRVSLMAALVQRLGEGRVSRYQGSGILDGSDADIAAAAAGAHKADIAIL